MSYHTTFTSLSNLGNFTWPVRVVADVGFGGWLRSLSPANRPQRPAQSPELPKRATTQTKPQAQLVLAAA